MTLVTVPQSNPNDEITALSVNQGPNAIATILNGQIDDTNISSISGTKVAAGTIPAAGLDTNANPETREFETLGDVTIYGLVWAATSGLAAGMSAGLAYITGKRLTPTAIATNTFTASKDTYVYLDSTGTVQYNPQTNGAAEPTIPTNYITLAKVVTNGSAVTSVVDLRPTPGTVRYAEITSSFVTTSNTYVPVPGLTGSILVPANGRRYKFSAEFSSVFNSNASVGMFIAIFDGAVPGGTQIAEKEIDQNTATFRVGGTAFAKKNVAAGFKTYNVGVKTTGGSATFLAAAAAPAFLDVEPA